MTKPLVSIIIPMYNAAANLAETVNSALNQTWTNKEIILVDDGSTDNSLQVAKSFDSGEIKVFSQQNKGASSARNAGLREARGGYIQFLDADDLLSPDKIEKQITCLNGSLTQVSIGQTVYFDDGQDHLTEGVASNNWFDADHSDPVDFLTKLYAGDDVMPGFGGMIADHSWLTPRKLIDAAGPWNESLSLDDDGEFFCRVVLASAGVKFCNEGFNYYRKFDTQLSLSAQKSKKGIESAILAIDLKLGYLKAKSQDPIIGRVFAKHYWWTGVLAYPQFKTLSAYCIRQAKQLGYSGEKYVGGRSGHILAAVFGWKAARLMARYRQQFKSSWA